MRSLTIKLTLAFLLIGVSGAGLAALLLGQRTRAEFNRFLSSQEQFVLFAALTEHYLCRGSWAGVETTLQSQRALAEARRLVALTDANGVVVADNAGYPRGATVDRATLNSGTALTLNARTIGYAIAAGDGAAKTYDPASETTFREQLAWASGASAVVAAALALIAGVLLARTLTRPLRELTAATQALAGGNLAQQVSVRSRDEVGALASSFNQMSADLARASHVRTQMAADLAHDLRTPLSILRGYTEGLKDDRLRGTPQLYATMHDEVIHLQRLVEDLRVLSLADAGELPLNQRAVDPAALLERTGLAYIVAAEQQGIALSVEPEPVLPSILVDTDRMTQVLNNLVSNALRHTTRGAIRLAAAFDGRCVRLLVRDTGCGIAPDDLPFIFDRFYRADKARQRTDSCSSGLGLAIAKAIVEAHDGSLTVESRLGHGTTFTIAMPAAPLHG